MGDIVGIISSLSLPAKEQIKVSYYLGRQYIFDGAYFFKI